MNKEEKQALHAKLLAKMKPEERELITKMEGTKEHLDEMLKMAMGGASSILTDEPQDSLNPVLFYLAKNTEDPDSEPEGCVAAICGVDFNDPEQKRAAMRNIGRKLRDEKIWPLAVAFISEAWFVKRSKEELEDSEMPRPSECADRQEIISLMGMTNTGIETAAWVMPITRGQDGKIIPGEWENFVPEGGTVRPVLVLEVFAGLLDDEQAVGIELTNSRTIVRK